VTSERFAVRAARTLVALYPRRLRDEYGDDMVALVREQCRDEPAGRVCVRFLIDLAITVPKTHLEVRMNRIPSPVVPLFYMAVAFGGLLTAVLGGSQIVTVVLGLAVALLARTLGAVAWRQTATAVGRSLADAWWKFLLAGPTLVAMVIVAAGAGVESWYLGMAAVLTALVLTGVGVVLGLMRFAGRSRPITS